MIIVRDRLVILTELNFGIGSTEIVISIMRGNIAGFLIILYRLVIFPQLALCISPIVVCCGIVGLDFNGFIKVFYRVLYRFVILPKLRSCNPQLVVCCGIVGIDFNGFLKVRYRLVIFT